jgi:DNA-directed RNA polymerase subunit H (RpoH/RPB5)
MSIVPQLLPIEINSEERKNKVLTNVVKMLTERKLLNLDNLESNIKKITSIQTDDFIYKLELNNPELYYEKTDDNKVIMVKLINQKITGVTKSSGISDFLHTYKNNPKLIIVNLIANKAKQHIEVSYPKTEIFMEKEMMINIVEHIAVPKHILLSDEEANSVLLDYNSKKRNMPKILSTDAIARYYNMKPGQLCKIIRPSEISGSVPFYRLVIKGQVTSEK